MAPAPKSPKEQDDSADQGAASVEDAGLPDRLDRETSVRPAQPGDADLSPGRQRPYGNLKQNLTNHWKVQERQAADQT